MLLCGNFASIPMQPSPEESTSATIPHSISIDTLIQERIWIYERDIHICHQPVFCYLLDVFGVWNYFLLFLSSLAIRSYFPNSKQKSLYIKHRKHCWLRLISANRSLDCGRVQSSEWKLYSAWLCRPACEYLQLKIYSSWATWWSRSQHSKSRLYARIQKTDGG